MFKSKIIISITIFVVFLIITSFIKNETRLTEKEISNLNSRILYLEKNINEAQLEYYYLASPVELETRLNTIGFDKYKPIPFSKIFFDFSDLENIQNKISDLKNLNEKKIKNK
tara:strand:+ start:256 stop:594 length:339 start_codon:yes stop_codon:yes gene_type:complete